MNFILFQVFHGFVLFFPCLGKVMVTRDMEGDRTFAGFGGGKPSDSFADCRHRLVFFPFYSHKYSFDDACYDKGRY